MAVTSKLSPIGVLQFFDDNGEFLVGGKLLFKVAGTSTLATTYQNYALTIPHENPIILNARGETANIDGDATPVFLDPLVSYKISLAGPLDDDTNPSDPYWVVDNISNADITTLASSLKTGNYTVVAGDNNKIILVDASSGNVTLTADAISALFDGFNIIVQKIDSSANTVSFSPNVANLVNGVTSIPLNRQYESLQFVVANGTWTALINNVLKDNLGQRVLDTASTASAVNYLRVTNAATGNNPVISVAGSDAAIGATITVKGESAALVIKADTRTVAIFDGEASGVNYLTMVNAVTGSGPLITAGNSADTNVDINYTTKGTGKHIFNYTDARTTTVSRPMTITGLSNNTSAAGYGTGVEIRGENGSGTAQAIGSLDFVYGTVTAGSERTFAVISSIYAGTFGARWTFAGDQAGGACVLFTEATVSRRVTLPDHDVDFDESLIVAWIEFNGSTGAITKSYNVSSLSKGGTGVYTINLTSSCSAQIVTGTVDAAGGIATQAISSSSVTINTFTTSTGVLTDFTGVYCAVIGRW